MADEKINHNAAENVSEAKKSGEEQISEALKSFEASEAEEIAKAEAQTDGSPEPQKRRWLFNFFLIAIIAIGVYLMFRITSEFNDTHKTLWDILNETDTLFAILALAVLIVILGSETMKYSVIMRALTGKSHFMLSLRTMFLGKYYDNITPFSTGGQPMQIYFLCKNGFAGGISGAVIMIKYFVNTFVWVIIAGVLMALNPSALGTASGASTLRILAWVGWGINMVIPVSVVLFVILPRFSYALVRGVISIGEKLKIVKDKEKSLARSTKVVTDFKASFAIMSKKPKMLVSLVACCAVETCLTFAFPYFIVKMFGGDLGGISAAIQIMAINAFTAFAVSFVPTPGNSGVWEGASSVAFKTIASSAWVLFTWRFFVYYIYIIIGLGITVYEVLKNTLGRKSVKNKK